MAMKKPKTTAAPKKAPAKKTAPEKKLVGKPALVDAIAKELGTTGVTASKKDVGAFVDAFLKVVREEADKGGTIRLIGFGSFEKKTVAAHKGRSPRTGEEIEIAAHDRLYFKSHVQF